MAGSLLGAERQHDAVLPGEADRPRVVALKLVQAQARVDNAGIKTAVREVGDEHPTTAKNARDGGLEERRRRRAYRGPGSGSRTLGRAS